MFSGTSCENKNILREVSIEDIWGEVRRLSVRLKRVGLTNAFSFAQAPFFVIRSIGGVTLERTQRELSGICCLEMEEIAQPMQEYFAHPAHLDEWLRN